MRASIPAVCSLTLLLLFSAPPGHRALGGPVRAPGVKTTPRTFDGPSSALTSTTIVPGFATPLLKQGNVVWCSTVEMAWQALGRALGGPLEVPNGGAEVLRLNAAPPSDLPESAYYVDGGRTSETLFTRIERTMQAKFGLPVGVDLRTPAPAYLGYAFLKADVPFQIPYQGLPEGLPFRGTAARRSAVRAFGFEPGAPEAMRRQVQVLYLQDLEGFDASPRYSDFVLDLDATSSPFQVLVAVVSRGETLEAIWRTVLGHIDTAGRPRTLAAKDSLAIPMANWRIVHRFNDLTGLDMRLANPGHEDQHVSDVLQITTFRLDANGAAVESVAVSSTRGGDGPLQFHVNRPYLLAMRTRGSRRPFLALWIENAELLAEMPK